MVSKTRTFNNHFFKVDLYKFLTVAIFISTIFTSPSIIANKYNISDLEVLQKTQAHLEFFNHAHDVSPSKRSQYWVKMVSDMAQSYIDEQRKLRNYNKKSYELIKKLSSWPRLRGDEFFQIKRNSYNVKYFSYCLVNSEDKKECKQEIYHFWRHSNKNPDTGYKLAQYLTGFFPLHSPWTIVKEITTSNASKFYCQRPLMAQALNNAILSEPFHKYSKQKLELKLNQMANKDCWKKYSTQGIQELFMNDNPLAMGPLFNVLDHLGFLSSDQKKVWLTYYYLHAPAPGKILNKSWNVISALSQNFELRTNVLKKLKNFNPLADKIFAGLSNKRNLVLFEHLNSNFPEYTEYYVKTCLDYLEGKRVFNRGNPTVHCEELFSYDKTKKMLGKKIIAQPLKIRFSATQKIKESSEK